MRSRILETVRRYYDEPFRSIHNFDHPLEMFSEADRLGIDLTLPQELAIGFHDVMNLVDPEHLGGNFNEGVSAHLMRAHARTMGIGEEVAEEACVIILCTDHVPREGVTRACAEVLDLDLLRFALPYDRFLSHSMDAHREWRHVIPALPDFMAARARYLHDRFLPRERIFLTEHFDEGAARSNLERYMNEFGRVA